ncbi:MAG: hypothetical protein OXG19_10675 [Chloroflexi bacterium]|nr:hypothetical protein [Chloroflexota bacterium]
MTSEEQLAVDLRQRLAILAAIDIDKVLVQSDQLGTLAFLDLQDTFQSLVDSCARLRDLDWNKMPPTQVRQVSEHTNSVTGLLEKIARFKLTEENAPERRKQLGDDLRNAVDAMQVSIVPVLTLSMWDSGELEKLRNSFNQASEQARSESEKLITEIQKSKDEATSDLQAVRTVLEAVRQASPEVGLSHHQDTFRQVAKEYQGAAAKWLGLTVLAGAVTVIGAIAWIIWWTDSGPLNDISDLQSIIGKLIVLSIGSFFTIQASRLYKSNKHLQIINRHRADSLTTFRAFVEATDEDDTKEKVLLEACHAIFGQVPTGLISESDKGSVEFLDGAVGIMRRGN